MDEVDSILKLLRNAVMNHSRSETIGIMIKNLEDVIWSRKPVEKPASWNADHLVYLSDSTLKSMKSDLEGYVRDLVKDLSLSREMITEALDLIDEINLVLNDRRSPTG